MKKLSTVFLVSLSVLLIFVSCKEEKKREENPKIETNTTGPLSMEETKHYKEVGGSMVKATFSALSTNLKDALQKGGVSQAVEYCNIVALPLTDSLSKQHDATIKRTSLKLRNPENLPSKDEGDILKKYQKSLNENLEINPLVIHWEDGYVKYFHHIYTNDLCLKCHGTIGKELSNENQKIISALYPEDQAIGYSDKELRGMWSIVMKRDWTGE